MEASKDNQADGTGGVVGRQVTDITQRKWWETIGT